MAKKNFLLMSLEDSKIKKISNVISNDSCRKILDFLSEKEASESEIAQSLQLPISTVHYNLQQLMETGLVSADEYHYSKKGKEINHYKLANKYIIIAPKKTWGIKEKLKGILPVVLIAGGAALAIHTASKYLAKGAMYAKSAVAERAMAAPSIAASAMQPRQTNLISQNIALWFLAGAVFALLSYLILGLMRKEGNQ